MPDDRASGREPGYHECGFHYEDGSFCTVNPYKAGHFHMLTPEQQRTVRGSPVDAYDAPDPTLFADRRRQVLEFMHAPEDRPPPLIDPEAVSYNDARDTWTLRAVASLFPEADDRRVPCHAEVSVAATGEKLLCALPSGHAMPHRDGATVWEPIPDVAEADA